MIMNEDAFFSRMDSEKRRMVGAMVRVGVCCNLPFWC